uniref:Uncharacterized protein n=1 Tax=Magnetococcus massalia (strain MO-1) TaxID=451514 RepID=A0A1S7LMV3_MAGMO|nr:protein of unknown function [Candidatus Magnetococcus massalia]
MQQNSIPDLGQLCRCITVNAPPSIKEAMENQTNHLKIQNDGDQVSGTLNHEYEAPSS